MVSGFLLFRIITHDINIGRFSIFDFWLRRAYRIFPALVLVLTATYLTSYFLFLPAAHKVVGQYVVSSLLSASNILLFIKTDDYFGLTAASNPLFHMWSLGVEEQFYLCLPLLLLILSRIEKRGQGLILLIACIVSFAFGVSEVLGGAIASFYMVHARAWELLIGAMIAIYGGCNASRYDSMLSIFGLFVIVACVVSFDATHAFPHSVAFLPVFATGIVLVFTRDGSLVARALGGGLFVYVGRLSYSIYLWHLPMLVFYRYLFSQSYIGDVLACLLTILLSHLSYTWVEQPGRRSLFKNHVLILSLLMACILGVTGVQGHLNGGFVNRSDVFHVVRQNNGLGLACNGNTQISPLCSTSERPSVAVVGNSYAMTLVEPIAKRAPDGVVQLTVDSCPIGVYDQVNENLFQSCHDFYLAVIATLQALPSIDTVILSSPFDLEVKDANHVAAFLSFLNRLDNKNVVVVGPTPQAPHSVGECYFKSQMFLSYPSCDFIAQPSHLDKIHRLEALLAPYGNTRFVDLTPTICPDNECKMAPTDVSAMYYDTGHLTFSGAERIVALLAPQILH